MKWFINECPPQALTMRKHVGEFTPLHTACYNYEGIPSGDDDEIIQLLASACPQAAGMLSIEGDTALHLYCYRHGTPDTPPNRLTLQALLEASPQSAHVLNDNQDYPVALVCRHFHYGNLDRDELALLIDAFGSDLLTIRDDEGKTVLHRAIDFPRQEADVVGILASKFGSLLEGNHEGGTILHYLCAKTGLEASLKVAYLKVLVTTASKLAIVARNDQGETPLHVLCSNEEVTAEQLKVLAPSENAVSARGPQGQTPLHVLCSNNNVSEELLQVLLHTCPSLAIAQDDNGQLPLHKMALKDEAVATKPTFHASLLRLHAAFPSAIHARDSPATRTTGMTPLEVACFETEDASLTLVYQVFRMDPVAVLVSWQEANAVKEKE